MPATFPSHQAVVLPLKLWRPCWFDGVALCVGAASPDVSYLIDGSGIAVWPMSHTVPGLVLWCLPVTLVVCWLFRLVAATVAAHLPTGGPFALRDYGVLSVTRHRWWITGSSALIGAATHLVWDNLSAPSNLAENTSHVVGAIAAGACFLHIGRHRLLVRWHGPAPAVPRRSTLFWSTAALVFAAGMAVTPTLPGAFLPHTTGVRIIAAVAVGLIAGAGAVRLTRATSAVR
jgi:hypothetical protein